MKKILILILLAFLLAACGPKTQVCPDGSVVTDITDCPIVQEAQKQLDEIKEMTDDLPSVKESADQVVIEKPTNKGSLDPTIQSLIDKRVKVKGYTFNYAPVEFNSGHWTALAQNTYYVYGDKVKVKLMDPMTIAVKTFYNYVFYEVGGESHAFCINEKTDLCEADVVERTVDTSEFKIDLPDTWITHIPSDATIRNGPMKWNRQTKIIEYEEEGKYYQLFLDDFYGMVLQASIYDDAEREDIVGGVEYRDMVFGGLSEEDVTPPQ